jgi:hypothetical protein
MLCSLEYAEYSLWFAITLIASASASARRSLHCLLLSDVLTVCVLFCLFMLSEAGAFSVFVCMFAHFALLHRAMEYYPLTLLACHP